MKGDAKLKALCNTIALSLHQSFDLLSVSNDCRVRFYVCHADEFYVMKVIAYEYIVHAVWLFILYSQKAYKLKFF